MPVTFFHGEEDANSPLALIRKVVLEVPGAQLVTYKNEAHLSTLCNHFDDVAKVLRGD